jgi:hypothetical protein
LNKTNSIIRSWSKAPLFSKRRTFHFYDMSTATLLLRIKVDPVKQALTLFTKMASINTTRVIVTKTLRIERGKDNNQ